MSTQVNTNKVVFEKNKYQQTIDTSFTQLVPPPPDRDWETILK